MTFPLVESDLHEGRGAGTVDVHEVDVVKVVPLLCCRRNHTCVEETSVRSNDSSGLGLESKLCWMKGSYLRTSKMNRD